MYYVYLLKLNNGAVYTGSTNDLQARILKHRKGSVLATKGKRPVEMVFYGAFVTKKQAVEFESYLKTGSGQAFRNRHLVTNAITENAQK